MGITFAFVFIVFRVEIASVELNRVGFIRGVGDVIRECIGARCAHDRVGVPAGSVVLVRHGRYL